MVCQTSCLGLYWCTTWAEVKPTPGTLQNRHNHTHIQVTLWGNLSFIPLFMGTKTAATPCLLHKYTGNKAKERLQICRSLLNSSPLSCCSFIALKSTLMLEVCLIFHVWCAKHISMVLMWLALKTWFSSFEFRGWASNKTSKGRQRTENEGGDEEMGLEGLMFPRTRYWRNAADSNTSQLAISRGLQQSSLLS